MSDEHLKRAAVRNGNVYLRVNTSFEKAASYGVYVRIKCPFRTKRNQLSMCGVRGTNIIRERDDNGDSANRYGRSEIYNSPLRRASDKPTRRMRRRCVIDGGRMSRYNGNERGEAAFRDSTFASLRGSRKSWVHNSRLSLLNIMTTRCVIFNYRHRCRRRYAFTC